MKHKKVLLFTIIFFIRLISFTYAEISEKESRTTVNAGSEDSLPEDVDLVDQEEYDKSVWVEQGQLKYKIAANNKALTIYLQKSEMVFIQKYIKSLQAKNVIKGITVIPIDRKGDIPCLVLQGGLSELKKTVKILDGIKKSQIPPVLVGISVNLQRIAFSNKESLGMAFDLLASYSATKSNGTTGRVYNLETGNYANYTVTTLMTTLLSANLTLNLDESSSKGEILLSGDVYTDNGQSTELKSTDQMVITVRNSSRDYSYQYLPITTNIKILPLVLNYDPMYPDDSEVRLDMLVDMSTVAGEETGGGMSSPISTSKTLNARKTVRANGEPEIAGILVTDSSIITNSGLPILGGMPFIGDFFTGSKNKRKNYSIGVLTVSVRLLPI